MSARIRTFLKPDMFYPDSCQRGQLNSPGERFQNNAVSLGGLTWFRVDGGPIRVKRYLVLNTGCFKSSFRFYIRLHFTNY